MLSPNRDRRKGVEAGRARGMTRTEEISLQNDDIAVGYDAAEEMISPARSRAGFPATTALPWAFTWPAKHGVPEGVSILGFGISIVGSLPRASPRPPWTGDRGRHDVFADLRRRRNGGDDSDLKYKDIHQGQTSRARRSPGSRGLMTSASDFTAVYSSPAKE